MSEQRGPTYDKTTHTGTGTDNKIDPTRRKNSGTASNPQADQNSKADAGKESPADGKRS